MSDDLIVALIEAGTPAPLVARVARELARADAERSILADRRQHERERKARSRDVTGQDVTARDSADTPNATPVLDKESVPQTPFKEIKPTPNTHTAPARGAVIFVCPEGIEQQHWSDFLANRKRKNLTNTETAYAGQLRLIEQFADDEWPPGKLVQLAAEKGWGTIVNPRESEHRNGRRQPQSAGPGITERAASRVLDEFRAATADPIYGK